MMTDPAPRREREHLATIAREISWISVLMMVIAGSQFLQCVIAILQ